MKNVSLIIKSKNIKKNNVSNLHRHKKYDHLYPLQKNILGKKNIIFKKYLSLYFKEFIGNEKKIQVVNLKTENAIKSAAFHFSPRMDRLNLCFLDLFY